MEEGGEAAGSAGEFGRPAGEVGEVAAAGGQPRLQLTLEPEQQLPRRLIEGEQGRPVVAGRRLEVSTDEPGYGVLLAGLS